MKQRRLLALLLAFCLFTGCAGCAGNLVNSDYREIDQLELVQTLGVDSTSELVTVTAATSSLREPVVLRNSSVSVSRALREMQDYTSKKYIFYGHTRHLLVGEDAARKSLSFYMEYMERGVEMRLDTKLYLVQGGSAEAAISATTDENGSVGDLLDSLEKDVQLMGESHVFDCGDVAEQLAENGCALAAAIMLIQEDNILSGAKSLTLQSSGFAILKDEKLVDFLDINLSRGANLLIDQGDNDVVEVPDGRGGWAAVRMTDNRVNYEPVFEDGALKSVKIKLELTCNLDELQNPLDIYETETIRVLEQGVASIEKYRVEQVIARSQSLEADFCDIRRRLKMRAPIRFSKLADSWETLFPTLDIQVEAKAKLMRTYDVGLSPIRSWMEGRS